MCSATNSHMNLFYAEAAPNKNTGLQGFRCPIGSYGVSTNGQD